MGNGPDQREVWGSRIGLILAAAGNAIGIGNLLRFPGQAAQHGGGAFMVPYVVCLLLFGFPMMWVAWTVGRYGGRFGHGTTPGMFDRLWKAPISKYLGVLGVAIPLIFCLYYTYIEAWCLGYSYFSMTGDYLDSAGRNVNMALYLDEFLGASPTSSYFSGLTSALVFLLITVGLNVFILYRGVARGIEILAKVAVPLLLLFCLVLAVRIFTMEDQRGSALQGLNFLWSPDMGALLKPGVWVAAAGQIFFTLSIGMGSLECYASYLRENDDIALTGLTTASTNEFFEIIFGSLIAIPAAAVFFGGEASTIQGIAQKGTFHLGMISMPEVLRSIPGLEVFGTIWFLLLFFAAFTSSVAVCQPVMAFLQDEVKLTRGTAAAAVGLVWFLGSLPVLYFLKYGVLDEMDFWAGKIGLVVFSTIEVVIFAWIFKLSRGWEELHRGAGIRVPRVFYFITLVVTPVCLLVIFGFWFGEAINDGTFIPKPKVNYAVVDTHTFAGEFTAPSRSTDEAGDDVGDEADDSESFDHWLKQLVTSEARDLKLWVAVDIAADGRTLTVTGVEGDPVLKQVATADRLQAFLESEGFGFQSYTSERKDLEPASASVTVAFDCLHTAPFIWMTRILILVVILAIVGCIRAIWKRRAEIAGEESGVA